MKASVVLPFFVIFFTFCYSKSAFEKLLVVSYDGFRYDYLDVHKNTFPNHFTLATGLYSGVHGVLGTKVYDEKRKQIFTYDELFHYNKDILPIWALNEKAGEGRHSGVMMWPGSNLAYNNILSTFVFNYSKTESYESRVSTVISWLTHSETPANFVMMYFEEPDSHSHGFGPDSPENLKQIQRVDNTTKYLLDSLKNNNLTDVNIVFLSDHGMEGVTKARIIDLESLIGNKALMYGTSPVLQIYPKPGENVAGIYNILKEKAHEDTHFKVYLKDNIPEHFQMRDCGRTPPILAVAEPPYAFQDLYKTIDWFVKNMKAPDNGTYGVHGYDPNDVKMHPYFIAHGPQFKENYYAGEMRSIDMFSLFTHVLKLENPLIKPNGSFYGVNKIFKSSSPRNIVLPGLYLTLGGAFLCLYML